MSTVPSVRFRMLSCCMACPRYAYSSMPVYSDDSGRTWHAGTVIPVTDNRTHGIGEPSVSRLGGRCIRVRVCYGTGVPVPVCLLRRPACAVPETAATCTLTFVPPLSAPSPLCTCACCPRVLPDHERAVARQCCSTTQRRVVLNEQRRGVDLGGGHTHCNDWQRRLPVFHGRRTRRQLRDDCFAGVCVWTGTLQRQHVRGLGTYGA